MKKKTMILLFSLPGLFLILCALTFRPISNPQMDECSLLQGKLAKVKSDPKTKDIYLRLEDVDRHQQGFRKRSDRRLPEETDRRKCVTLCGQSLDFVGSPKQNRACIAG